MVGWDNEERRSYQADWEQYLNEKYCMVSQLTGNRPCDNGHPCDRCQTEEIRLEFEQWRTTKGA